MIAIGTPLQLAILLCVEMNDVFAYCTGKLFGRRKLAPQHKSKQNTRRRARGADADDHVICAAGTLDFYGDAARSTGAS